MLPDSAHDAMPYYEYCRRQNITPFIDLNGKGGYRIKRDGTEKAKDRTKFKYPKMNRVNGCLTCTCESPLCQITQRRIYTAVTCSSKILQSSVHSLFNLISCQVFMTKQSQDHTISFLLCCHNVLLRTTAIFP